MALWSAFLAARATVGDYLHIRVGRPIMLRNLSVVPFAGLIQQLDDGTSGVRGDLELTLDYPGYSTTGRDAIAFQLQTEVSRWSNSDASSSTRIVVTFRLWVDATMSARTFVAIDDREFGRYRRWKQLMGATRELGPGRVMFLIGPNGPNRVRMEGRYAIWY